MRSFGAKQITQAEAVAQMKMHLARCSDATLEKLTPADLLRIYRLPAKEIEYHLAVTQQKRREFIATGRVGA